MRAGGDHDGDSVPAPAGIGPTESFNVHRWGGGLLELPNFSVLVPGLDEWNYSRMPKRPVIPEPRPG